MRPDLKQPWQLFGLIALAVVVLAWSVAYSQYHSEQARRLAEAEARVANLAGNYATHADLALGLADETLRRLRTTALTQGTAAFIAEARLVSREDTGGPINRVALIDAHGMMQANFLNGEAVAKVNVADRSYYRGLVNRSDDRIFVTEPILGKVSGKWIVLFARPLLVDGVFQGLIFVGFETGKLAHIFERSTAPGELVTLLSPEGRVLARSQEAELHTGKHGLLPAIPADTIFNFISPLDGIERLSWVTTVPNWGMRIYAGIDRQRLKTELQARARAAALPALLLTLLLLLATWLLRRGALAQQIAAEQLRNEVQRSRMVFESMREGILMVDHDGHISFANSAASQLLPAALGKPLSEAARLAGLQLVTEDGTPYGSDPVQRICCERGHALIGAWLHHTGHGEHSLRWAAVTGHPMRDAGGQLTGAIVSIADLTQEHERLTDSALTESILAGMQDGVMITDYEGRIVKVNAGFTRLTGYSAAEAIGQTPSLLRSGRHDAAFFESLWIALRTDGHWSGRLWNQRKDGTPYCVWHTITSVRDVQGRILRYVAVSRDITEQQTLEQTLWQRANFDPLTGVANRARFADRLSQLLHQALRHQHHFALIYVDLDRFKPVNDLHGHAAGDALLRQVAERLQHELRSEDLLARIGGDEFALLLPRVRDQLDVTRACDRIIAAIDQPFVLNEGTVSIGASLGIALYPEHGDSPQALRAAADAAMYQAKTQGRHCWRMAESHPAPDSAPPTTTDPT